MVQAAHSSPTPATNGGHPSAPSRLLSKHRPRRRAAPPRPNLPTPASTRGQPDLYTCRCCEVILPPPPGAKRSLVRPLRSVWRIVLLCTECISLVHSAVVCSYCLSLEDDLLSNDSFVNCRSCSRCVHHHCILSEHRTALIQPVDVENFVCVDCCPVVKPRISNGGATSIPNKPDASVRDTDSTMEREGDATAVAKLNLLRERRSAQLKPTPNCENEVIALIDGDVESEMIGTSDPDLADKDLALQLHLAMNGSPRISRSCCGGSFGQEKGEKCMSAGRKGNGNHEICVTNMMDQLDDDDDDDVESETDTRSNSSANHVGFFDPSVTIVLALECPCKHAQWSTRARRKSLRVTKHYGLVDRFKKKYIKRKHVHVGSTRSKTMPEGDDDGSMT